MAVLKTESNLSFLSMHSLTTRVAPACLFTMLKFVCSPLLLFSGAVAGEAPQSRTLSFTCCSNVEYIFYHLKMDFVPLGPGQQPGKGNSHPVGHLNPPLTLSDTWRRQTRDCAVCSNHLICMHALIDRRCRDKQPLKTRAVLRGRGARPPPVRGLCPHCAPVHHMKFWMSVTTHLG